MLDLQPQEIRFVVERGANPSWHLTKHCNEDHCILAYAREGKAEYTFYDSNQKVTVRRGNVLFIPSGTRYSAYADGQTPWAFTSCAFTMTVGNVETAEFLATLPNVFTASDSTHMTEDFAELFRAWTAGDTGTLLQCRACLLDILYLLLSDAERRKAISAHDTKIREIADFLRQNYAGTYGNEELSAMAGLSSSHFRTLFRQVTGLTVVQYVTQIRIARAKDLLLSDTCNVTEAAHAVGYSEVFYFSRVFRKVTGKNPSEFMHRGEGVQKDYD